MSEFRAKVGEQVTLFRAEHLPKTHTTTERHARWRRWLEDVAFDHGWDKIKSIDDDIINELAQGKRDVEYAIAVYYRLHAELHADEFAREIDTLVFDEAQREQGIVVFVEDERVAPPATPQQPQLHIRLATVSSETRFLFRSRAIPYQEPAAAFEELDAVIADVELRRPFVWHALHGPGGSGKSRLALEYALHRRQVTGDAIGFLDATQSRTFDWIAWQPDRPTIMFVDYAARETELIGQVFRALSARSDLNQPDRLILFERDVTTSWFDRAILRGSSHAHSVERAWSGEDGFVAPPVRLWPIVVFMFSGRDRALPRHREFFAELLRIDPQMRPLYAAFLADAYARGEDPRRWDAYALVENVLEREKRFWDEAGVDDRLVNLCACSTFAGGVPEEWVNLLSPREFVDYWPSSYGNKTVEALSAVFGFPVVGDIPPLEPDILGEVFVLDYWARATKMEKARFLHFAEQMAPWFAEFLDRAVSDFPDETSLQLLQTAMHLNFEEHASVKPELLHNAVRDLVQSQPDIANSVFWMFDILRAEKPMGNLPECVVEAAFNLIVGSVDISLIDALDCYDLQASILPEGAWQLDYLHLRCELSAVLIARFPDEDHQPFRRILAHALKAYRHFPNDQKLIRETSLAMHDYVDKLRQPHFPEALRWLRRFEQIADKSDDKDVRNAQEDIRFHVLLLGLALAPEHGDLESAARLVFKDMQAPTGIGSEVYPLLLKRLNEEMLDV